VAGTLADMATQSSNPFERGVVEKFRQTSDWIKLCPYKTIKGQVYRYRQEEVQPGISWRNVNAQYPESTGVIAPRTEPTMIVGGDIFLDNALLNTARSGGDAIDYQQSQYGMKARSLAREIERASFEGDDLVNDAEMMGLRARLTGNQVIYLGTAGAGAAMTTAGLDLLLDALDMSIGQAHLWMSKADRRKLTGLVLGATSGAAVYNFSSVNDAGPVIERYMGVPIHVVEDGWDATHHPRQGRGRRQRVHQHLVDLRHHLRREPGRLRPALGRRRLAAGRRPRGRRDDLGPAGDHGAHRVLPRFDDQEPRAAARWRGVI
jgi:hypothetical protein